MKRLLLPLVVVALSLSLQRASAASGFYDPFADATAAGGTTYTAGSGLATQQPNSTNVWGGVNTGATAPAPLVVAGSLSVPGLPQSSGNSISFAPAIIAAGNQGVRLNFPGVTNAAGGTGVFYFSYILKLTSISQVSTNAANNWFAGFSDGAAAQPGAVVARVGTRILTKATNSGFVLGVGRNNTPADYVYDTTVHNLNESIFVVGSYELVGGVTNVNLWINPATNTFGSNAVPTPTVSATHFANTTGNLNTNGVVGFVIVCQNTNAPSGLIDEFRMGTNWATITGGDPAILTQPANAAKPAGTTATFTVVARGTAPLTYQWIKDGNPLTDGGNILGSATATLSVSSISAGDLGSYSVFVTNGVGSFVQSSSATLSFQTDPGIVSQPQNLTTNFGTTATFSVTASGTAPISYVWHKNSVDLNDGGNISGSRTNVLTLSNVAFADNGSYSVTVSNLNGPVDSSAATLTVIDPFITSQPVSTTNNAGATATFSVTAVGTGGAGSFTYQWFKNGNFFFDGGNASGTLTPTLTLTSISSTDQASYFVTIVGSSSTVTSSVVTLTVSTPVSVAVQPNPRTVVPGVRVAFGVGAAGSAPIFYQWALNGTPISGATGPAYIVTNAQAAVAGNYSVTVSNSFSTNFSSTAALTISSNLTLSQSNLIVIRVGDGAQALGLNGNSIYLDQYSTSGAYLNTVTIPDSGSNALIAVGQDNSTGVNAGATTGSCLTQSLDGRFMVIAGYNTNLTFGSAIASASTTNVPRAVGLIESHGSYTMPVASTNTAFNAGFNRSAITDGTNNYWGGADQPGTWYFGFDSAPALIQTNMVNMRSMSLFNGNIYGAGAVAGQTGVLMISGMPKTPTNGTFLFAGSSGTFDMAVSPSGNLIYVADQRAIGASAGGVQRWDLSGTNWNLTYTIQIGGLGAGSHGPRYLAVDFTGANPVIYVTSNDGTFDNNRIMAVTDTGAGSTGVAIANAGVNETFRGIHFGPVPNTVVASALLSFTTTNGNIILTWPSPFSLQSSTNVNGVYTNVTGATSPFTNSLGSDARRFFRLQH